jgi:hypothetical protein
VGKRKKAAKLRRLQKSRFQQEKITETDQSRALKIIWQAAGTDG